MVPMWPVGVGSGMSVRAATVGLTSRRTLQHHIAPGQLEIRHLFFVALSLCLLVHSVVVDVNAEPRRIGVMCNSCELGWSLFIQNTYKGIQEEIAAQNASERFVVDTINVQENSKPEDVAVLLANLSHVVTSSSLAPNVFAAALSLPSLFVTVMDPMRVPDALAHRTQTIALRDDQVGYLAGVLAGSQSEHGYVAFVGGPRILPLDNMRAGFFSGVLAVCPACSITSTNVNAFASAMVNTTEVALAMQVLAPDVVWSPGGAAGSAMLVAMSKASIATIGVDADEYTTTMQSFRNTSAASMLLSSSEKRTSVAVRVGLHDYIADPLSFVPSDRIVGVQQNCIDLSPCHESCWRWTARANETASTLVRRLKLGLVSTGVDTNTGYLSINRRTTSISVSRPPISATQHVAFAAPYVLSVACWGLIVVFDGRWNVVTLYDDALQTILQVLVVVAPSMPPVLGGGHSLVPLTFAPLGVEAIVLVGGQQNGVASNASYALVTVCSTPGLCTNKATWCKVVMTASNSTHDTLPPLAFHAAAAPQGASRMYVAGGVVGDASVGMDGVWRLDCTLPSPTRVACALRRLSFGLPRAMHTFTLSVWSASSLASEDTLIVSGGVHRVLAWRRVSDADHGDSTVWEDGTATAQQLGASIRQQPCVFRRDSTTVVMLGAGAMGESLFLRPTHPVAARRLTLGGARTISSASVLSVLTQERLSCAVLLSRGSAPTSVGYAGWSPSLLQTNFHQVFLLGVVTAESTQGLVQYSIPWISCDANRDLLRSDDLTSCVACVGKLINDTCTPPGGEGRTGIATTTITVVGVVVGVFVVGLGVGLVAFGAKLPLALVRLRGRASTPPPLQFPLSIVFVNLCGSAQTWQTNPMVAGKHLRRARAVVAWAAQRHDCYLVKVLADSFLLAASNPEAALRFAVALQELTLPNDKHTCNKAATFSSWCFTGPGVSWPEGLTLRIVLHHGSRVRIQASEGNGYDYSGPDVQAAIAGRWCATGATRDIAVALDAYSTLCATPNPSGQAATELGIERFGVVHANGDGTARSGVVLGSTTYMIVRPASLATKGSGCSPSPGCTDAGLLHLGDGASAEDVHVEMPNFFAAEEIEPSTSTSEAILNWQRSVHAGASTSDVMHMFNAFETQQLTQFVAWAVDAAMMPLPPDKRRRLVKALCAHTGVVQDRYSAEHITSFSSSTTAAAASTSLGGPAGIPSHSMHRLAMSLLAQLDAMELRAALAELHPGPSSEMATLRSLRGSTSPPNELQ